MISLHLFFLFLIFFHGSSREFSTTSATSRFSHHFSFSQFFTTNLLSFSSSLRGFDLFSILSFPPPLPFFLFSTSLSPSVHETLTLSLSLSSWIHFRHSWSPFIQELLFIEPASGRLINGVCREIRIYNGAIPAREGSATTRLRVPASFDPRLVGRWTEFDWRNGNDREHESLSKLGENSLIDTESF